MWDLFWSMFSPGAVRRLTDPRSFGRGLAYAEQGRVEDVRVGGRSAAVDEHGIHEALGRPERFTEAIARLRTQHGA